MDPKIKDQAINFLKNNFLVVIATVSPEGKPEAATIHYFIDDHLNFCFITRRHTRKFINLQKNPNTAFVVGTILAPNTLQAEGIATFLEKKEDIEKFVVDIKDRPELQNLYSGPIFDPTFPKVLGLDLVVIKVDINWMRWMTLNKDRHEEYFQII